MTIMDGGAPSKHYNGTGFQWVPRETDKPEGDQSRFIDELNSTPVGKLPKIPETGVRDTEIIWLKAQIAALWRELAYLRSTQHLPFVPWQPYRAPYQYPFVVSSDSTVETPEKGAQPPYEMGHPRSGW